MSKIIFKCSFLQFFPESLPQATSSILQHQSVEEQQLYQRDQWLTRRKLVFIQSNQIHTVESFFTVLAINQTMKPLLKLCEETNQLTKEMIKENSEQLRLLGELINFPRDLQKLIHQLSRNLHLVRLLPELLFGYRYLKYFQQAKLLQTRPDDDEDNHPIMVRKKHFKTGRIVHIPARDEMHVTTRVAPQCQSSFSKEGFSLLYQFLFPCSRN